MPLPNLIVIGAQKCGTTSLHHYLDLHPEIAIACGVDSDEVHFFSWDGRWRRGLEWYARQFREAPVRGEVSTSYSWYPQHPETPARIARTLPGVRLIYLVRDPVERIVSQWHQDRAAAQELRPFEQAVLEDAAYVARSRYATQLERYLAVIPQEQLLVLDQHELRVRRTETLRLVFGFLGVEETFTSPRFTEERNVSGEARALTPRGRTVMLVLHRTVGHRATHAVAARVPFRLPGIERPGREPRPAVTPELAARLRELLAPEVERLRALTGQLFATWSV